MPWSRDPISLWPRNVRKNCIQRVRTVKSRGSKRLRGASFCPDGGGRAALGGNGRLLELHGDQRQVVGQRLVAAEVVHGADDGVDDRLRVFVATEQRLGQALGGESLAALVLRVDDAVRVQHQRRAARER